MTPEHPALYALDALALYADQTETHLQQHVLHREIGGHAAHRDGLLRFLSFPPSAFSRKEIERAGFV